MTAAGDIPRIDPIVGMKRTLQLYSRLISDLDRRLSSSASSLTERRILTDLLHRPMRSDARIAAALGMDRSQLSRALKKLIGEGLVKHEPASKHRRQRLLSLTDSGRSAAEELDDRLEQAIQSQFRELGPEDQRLMLRAMGGLGASYDEPGSYAIELRKPQLGDYGWLLQQAVASAGETGRGEAYVAHFAEVLRRFICQPFTDSRIGFIAHRLGTPVGGCLLIFDSEDGQYAEVGLLYVDPPARGLGLGTRLLSACVKEAREWEVLSVWAEVSERQTDLASLYQKHGLLRVRGKTEDFRFGPPETWRRHTLKLPLSRSTRSR